MKNMIVHFLYLVCFIFLFNGCGSDDSTTDEDSNSFSGVWTNAFDGNCATCHDGTVNSGPDLSTQSAFYSNTVGKTIGTNFPDYVDSIGSGCEDFQLIEAGKAGTSLLAASIISSISDAFDSSCTSSYSVHASNGSSVSGSIATSIINWINAGAKN